MARALKSRIISGVDKHRNALVFLVAAKVGQQTRKQFTGPGVAAAFQQQLPAVFAGHTADAGLAWPQQPQGQSIPERERQMLSPGVLAAMRHIVFSEFENIYSFEIPENDAEYISLLTEEYISIQTDYKFSALQLFKTLR